MTTGANATLNSMQVKKQQQPDKHTVSTEIRLGPEDIPYCQVANADCEQDSARRPKTSGSLFMRVRTFVFCLSLLQLVQVMASG